MKKNKGMSQVLSLIVAASVLMMVALSVIFLASGTLGDFGDAITGDSCTETIKSKCQTRGTDSINIPSSCIESNARGGEELVSEMPSGYSAMPDDEINQPEDKIADDAYISCQ